MLELHVGKATQAMEHAIDILLGVAAAQLTIFVNSL